MTVRAARPDEADVISALALQAKAPWGYDAAFLEACRLELTWSPEQVAQQDVLTRAASCRSCDSISKEEAR